MPVQKGQIRIERGRGGEIPIGLTGNIEAMGNIIEEVLDTVGSIGSGATGGMELGYGCAVSRLLTYPKAGLLALDVTTNNATTHHPVAGVLALPGTRCLNNRGAIGSVSFSQLTSQLPRLSPLKGDVATVISYGLAWMRTDAIVSTGAAFLRVSNSTAGANSQSLSGCLTVSTNANVFNAAGTITVIVPNTRAGDPALVFVDARTNTNGQFPQVAYTNRNRSDLI